MLSVSETDGLLGVPEQPVRGSDGQRPAGLPISTHLRCSDRGVLAWTGRQAVIKAPEEVAA